MRRWLTLSFLVLALPVASAAVEFYSIDIDSNELVRLDSTSGSLTVVGPTGFNFTSCSLARLGPALYANNAPAGTSGLVQLIELNPATGALISNVTVKNGAVNLLTTVAEGLTSDGTTLLMSYNTNASFPGFSHTLASLSTTGQLSGATAFPTNRDMDNIASLSGGPLYAGDGVVISPNNRVDLYNVAAPSTYTLLGSFFVTGNDGHSGYTFDDDGNLWAWRRGPKQLDRISTANGALLQSVSVSTSRNLRGLALASDGPVSTESSSWSRMKAGYR